MKISNTHLWWKKIYSNPNGLYFKLEGLKYDNLIDLINHITGTIEAHQSKSINIEWCWDYQGNDYKDTLEGTLALSYSFYLSLISEKL